MVKNYRRRRVETPSAFAAVSISTQDTMWMDFGQSEGRIG
jgi:hypothetical protein